MSAEMIDSGATPARPGATLVQLFSNMAVRYAGKRVASNKLLEHLAALDRRGEPSAQMLCFAEHAPDLD